MPLKLPKMLVAVTKQHNILVQSCSEQLSPPAQGSWVLGCLFVLSFTIQHAEGTASWMLLVRSPVLPRLGLQR